MKKTIHNITLKHADNKFKVYVFRHWYGYQSINTAFFSVSSYKVRESNLKVYDVSKNRYDMLLSILPNLIEDNPEIKVTKEHIFYV